MPSLSERLFGSRKSLFNAIDEGASHKVKGWLDKGKDPNAIEEFELPRADSSRVERFRGTASDYALMLLVNHGAKMDSRGHATVLACLEKLRAAGGRVTLTSTHYLSETLHHVRWANAMGRQAIVRAANAGGATWDAPSRFVANQSVGQELLKRLPELRGDLAGFQDKVVISDSREDQVVFRQARPRLA